MWYWCEARMADGTRRYFEDKSSKKRDRISAMYRQLGYTNIQIGQYRR